MELDELRDAWMSNNEKLEQRISINEQKIALIQKQQIQSKLAPLFAYRVIEMVFHAAAIVLLLIFWYQNFFQLPYAISAMALLAFYITLFINSLNLAMIVRKMDYDQDLASLQTAILLLQTRAVNYAKMTILFIPVFLSYPMVFNKVIKDYHITALAKFNVMDQAIDSLRTAQVVIFCVMIPLGIWFYREVTYKNMDKKWVRDFIRKSSGRRVEKALDFLKELQSLKGEPQL